MTDTKKNGINNNVPIVWDAVINGLLEGSSVSINNRIKFNIDQAFVQSSYLQH
jgi:hypothetical protein